MFLWPIFWYCGIFLIKNNNIVILGHDDYVVSCAAQGQVAYLSPLTNTVLLCNVPCRLSKELQHKDKIIESLHTKLQQRPETPSSCQALSETTDQSDRSSLVSDEYRTNEDLELCSELDAREFQEEQHLQQQGSEQDGMVDSTFYTHPLVS